MKIPATADLGLVELRNRRRWWCNCCLRARCSPCATARRSSTSCCPARRRTACSVCSCAGTAPPAAGWCRWSVRDLSSPTMAWMRPRGPRWPKPACSALRRCSCTRSMPPGLGACACATPGLSRAGSTRSWRRTSASRMKEPSAATRPIRRTTSISCQLRDDALGWAILARQNQSMAGGRHPWLALACATGAAAFCTDGWQFFGADHRLTGEPAAVRMASLPSKRLQYEFALGGLQSRALDLEPGATGEISFVARFLEDHPEASAPSDLARLKEILPVDWELRGARAPHGGRGTVGIRHREMAAWRPAHRGRFVGLVSGRAPP
jgi:hypothetical protein